MEERDEKRARRKRRRLCQWAEVRREHLGLRSWGAWMLSRAACEDGVINPLKMSDC